MNLYISYVNIYQLDLGIKRLFSKPCKQLESVALGDASGLSTLILLLSSAFKKIKKLINCINLHLSN